MKSVCICIDVQYETEAVKNVLFTRKSLHLIKSGTLHWLVCLVEIDLFRKNKNYNIGFKCRFMLTCNRHCSLSVIQTVGVQTEVTVDGQGFEHRAAVIESSLTRELSAGEVVRPAFDEQIKRSAGTLAFTLPLSSL